MTEFLVSIIIPVYNEGQQIEKSLRVIREVLIKNNINHEFIIIDDGSKDNTWSVLMEAAKKANDIHAIKLSRNFGKEAALCAGLEAATGDACIVMDGDLQHPPEMIPEMIRKWKEEGYQVVEGVKSDRGKENLINKVGAHFFYKILHKSSGFNLDGASDFKLLDSKVVNAWRQMNEHNTFFRGMSAWVGFNRATISFEVAERQTGTSKWSIVRLMKLAITAITSFSALPLQIVTLLGTIFLIGSFVLGIQTFYMKISGLAVSGFTTVILLLLLIGSSLMISLGIIGTYIARIYDEVKSRPRYIIEEKIDKKI